MISGVWYVSLAKYSCVVVGLVVTAVLARMLTPHDFGTVAIATVFIHLFSTIVTESFSPAIIQNKQLTERDLRAINSFTYLMALALTGLYLLAVPFIVAYYETEVLSTILTVFAVSIFFSIISIVPNALLMKAKRFRFIAMMSLGIHLALAVMSIAAVTQGMGIYALLVEPVGHGVLLFAVSYAAYPVKWSWPRRESVAKILSFSVFQMLYTAIHIGYRNIDKLLIGKYMGAANLGYYEKSYRLMMLPLENVSSVISPVLHPLLSEYQNDKDYLWEAYKKIIAFFRGAFLPGPFYRHLAIWRPVGTCRARVPGVGVERLLPADAVAHGGDIPGRQCCETVDGEHVVDILFDADRRGGRYRRGEF